ncbi:hypothetical protein [Corynebacterium stationis]|uniref:hypothetical protein n=1 Tax=Corynebacterium stationis TaxID=1705 RepID=UPI0028AB50F7|nr:hypothetical protein [Corynebacterium stationis]
MSRKYGVFVDMDERLLKLKRIWELHDDFDQGSALLERAGHPCTGALIYTGAW